MREPANREVPGVRKLVLGFDGGCATCSDLAERISQRVGDKLEVRSLHHPQVEHWRERAFGKDAPWTPTLFEVGGVGEVRAWTGAGMAVRLFHALGPASTWRVMKALGEIRAQKVDYAGPSHSMENASLSRGQFLKGMGGAALAFGVLSGLSSPALAAKTELDYEGLTKVFSAIEDIPDAAIAKGERAVRKWLSRRLQDDAEGQGRGFWGCVWAVGKFVALNAIPVAKILKIRQAIKALGGVRNFVAIFQYAYRATRKKGYKKWGAVWFAARHVAEVSGVEVASAIAAFFEIDAVWNNCTLKQSHREPIRVTPPGAISEARE